MLIVNRKTNSGITGFIRYLLLQTLFILVLATFTLAAYRIPGTVIIGGIGTPSAGHQVAQKIIAPAPADTEWAYLISLPATYDPNGTKLWPTLIWYGPACDMYSGGNGDISIFFTANFDNGGPAKYMQDSQRSNYSFIADRFIVISPFISSDIFRSAGGQPQRLKGLHKYLYATYKIDLTKVYLVGGCGGGGVIYNYCEYDSLGIAAMVPMSCNDTWFSTVNLTLACKLKNTWMRHYANQNDPVVPYANQVAMHTSLDNCHLTPRRDTLITFTSGAHEIWSTQNILNTAGVYDWMLTKTNTNISTAVSELSVIASQICERKLLNTRLAPEDCMEIINANGRIMYKIAGNGYTANQMMPSLARGLHMIRINHDNRNDTQILLTK